MLLRILEIIGIILLCAAAFVLLAAVLVLFVPVRYRICAESQDCKALIKARAGWLFGSVSVGAVYSDGKLTWAVKILCFKVMESGGDKPAKKKKAEKASGGSRKKKKTVKNGKVLRTAPEGLKRGEPEKADAKKPVKNTLLSKAAAAADKIKKLWEKIKMAEYVRNAPATKRAISFAKARLFELLSHIKPRRIRGHIVFSLDDPADTACAYAAADMLIEAAGYSLILEPDFEGSTAAEGNLDISGRIFISYVLLSVIRILKNKDIRRVVKYIRRNF